MRKFRYTTDTRPTVSPYNLPSNECMSILLCHSAIVRTGPQSEGLPGSSTDGNNVPKDLRQGQAFHVTHLLEPMTMFHFLDWLPGLSLTDFIKRPIALGAVKLISTLARYRLVPLSITLMNCLPQPKLNFGTDFSIAPGVLISASPDDTGHLETSMQMFLLGHAQDRSRRDVSDAFMHFPALRPASFSCRRVKIKESGIGKAGPATCTMACFLARSQPIY